MIVMLIHVGENPDLYLYTSISFTVMICSNFRSGIVKSVYYSCGM